MCIRGKKRSLEPVGRDPKKNSGSVWRSGLGTRLEDLVSQVRISHFILWKKDVPQDFRQPVTWSDLVSDSLLWQESRPGLSDGDQNQKNHRRLHQRFLWRMLVFCRPGHIPHRGEQVVMAARGLSHFSDAPRTPGGEVWGRASVFCSHSGQEGEPNLGAIF